MKNFNTKINHRILLYILIGFLASPFQLLAAGQHDIYPKGESFARVTNLILARARMGGMNSTICSEMGLGDGKERCLFHQVALRLRNSVEGFYAIQNPVTGRVDILLCHALHGKDGKLAEVYVYLTSPDAQLKKTLYGKIPNGRRYLSDDKALQDFTKTVRFWVKNERELRTILHHKVQ